jgi:hypothetical protein
MLKTRSSLPKSIARLKQIKYSETDNKLHSWKIKIAPIITPKCATLKRCRKIACLIMKWNQWNLVVQLLSHIWYLSGKRICRVNVVCLRVRTISLAHISGLCEMPVVSLHEPPQCQNISARGAEASGMEQRQQQLRGKRTETSVGWTVKVWDCVMQYLDVPV